MVYHTHGFSLTKAQMNSLKRLGSAKLKATDLSGPHVMHLTKVQMDKVTKGKGFTMKMGVRQHAHHKKVGGGFWDDVWGGIKSVVSNPVVQDLGKIGIKALIGGGSIKHVNHGVKSFLDEEESKHGMMHRRRLEHAINGSGFFDTIASIVKNPIVQDVGGVLLKHGIKALGGSLKSHHDTYGGSFR